MKSTRTDVLGVPVDAVNMETALESVRIMLAGTSTNVIVAVNPEKVIAAQKNPELLRALQNAALVIPDGIGVVLAARLLGKGSMERVPGSDLMPEICRICATSGYSVFLYGAKPAVVSEAAGILRQKYPRLSVAGTHHGYVAEDEMEDLVKIINVSGANALFVGLGSPRQELWMNEYRAKLNVQICQGVGGTFDALCGHPKRAPRALQKLHLEWLYRLISQPKRLHRQTALPRFVGRVLREALTRKEK